MTHMAAHSLSRRKFLGAAGACLLGAALPLRAIAQATTRQVLMVHQRTGETLAETYFDEGAYQASAVARFSHFARDLSAEATHEMDPRLLDFVWLIQQRLDPETPLVLTNGYRSAHTNRRTTGAAANSFHIKGQALDIAHPKGSRALHEAAAEAGVGGLGRYRTFVHIDTGPERRW